MSTIKGQIQEFRPDDETLDRILKRRGASSNPAADVRAMIMDTVEDKLRLGRRVDNRSAWSRQLDDALKTADALKKREEAE